jgi:hypothetical protein
MDTNALRGEAVWLGKGAFHTIADVAGLQVNCGEGSLWLTLDNDPRDIILEPGDSFFTTEHRRGLVYAFAPSRFTLREAAEVRQAEEAPRWRNRAVLGVAG